MTYEKKSERCSEKKRYVLLLSDCMREYGFLFLYNMRLVYGMIE